MPTKCPPLAPSPLLGRVAASSLGSGSALPPSPLALSPSLALLSSPRNQGKGSPHAKRRFAVNPPVKQVYSSFIHLYILLHPTIHPFIHSFILLFILPLGLMLLFIYTLILLLIHLLNHILILASLFLQIIPSIHLLSAVYF